MIFSFNDFKFARKKGGLYEASQPASGGQQPNQQQKPQQVPMTPEEEYTFNRAQIDRFRYALGKVMSKFKFFGSLVSKLEIIFTNKVKTACVDGSRMWVSPRFLSTLTEQQIIFLVAHEVLHCVFGHFARRGDRRPDLWNIAADLEINPRLIDEGLLDVAGLKKMRGLYDVKFLGKSAEEIYKILYEDKAEQQKQKEQGEAVDEILDENQGDQLDEQTNPKTQEKRRKEEEQRKQDEAKKQQQKGEKSEEQGEDGDEGEDGGEDGEDGSEGQDGSPSQKSGQGKPGQQSGQPGQPGKQGQKSQSQQGGTEPGSQSGPGYESDYGDDDEDDLDDEDDDDYSNTGGGGGGNDDDLDDDFDGDGDGDQVDTFDDFNKKNKSKKGKPGEEEGDEEGEGQGSGEKGDDEGEDGEGQGEGEGEEGDGGSEGGEAGGEAGESGDAAGNQDANGDPQAGGAGGGGSSRGADTAGVEGMEGGTAPKSALSGKNVTAEGRKLTADDWMNIAKKAASEYGAGKGIREALAKLAKPKVNWKKELSRIIASAQADVEWKLPNRRFVARGEYRYGMKNMENAFERVEIAIDISGSITDLQVNHFLSEVTALMKTWKIKYVDLIYFHSNVAAIDNLYLKPKFDKSKFQERGGTNFKPWINHITHLIKRDRKPVDLVIVFTDGENFDNPLPVPPWQKKCVWIIFDNFGHQIPFGRKIEISTSDL